MSISIRRRCMVSGSAARSGLGQASAAWMRSSFSTRQTLARKPKWRMRRGQDVHEEAADELVGVGEMSTKKRAICSGERIGQEPFRLATVDDPLERALLPHRDAIKETQRASRLIDARPGALLRDERSRRRPREVADRRVLHGIPTLLQLSIRPRTAGNFSLDPDIAAATRRAFSDQELSAK
jgi:hypothetical protein